MTDEAFARFPSTRWSLVCRVADPDIRVQREALAELLDAYMPALRSYLRQVRRIPTERADDLLQGFLVSKVLEDALIARAAEGRGRFRTFLLTALDRYIIDEYRKDQRLKRHPGTPADADALHLAPDPSPDAAAAFDRAWAQQLLAQAVQHMERQCREAGREALWGVFAHRVLADVIEGQAPLSYEALVEKYALRSPAAAANLLITAKRMYARCLRGLVAQYASDDDEIEQEIAELRKLLSIKA